MRESVWSIIVAAGSCARFGGPKQYQALGGARVLDWSYDLLAPVSDGIVVVVATDRTSDPEPRATVVAPGGDTRAGSVRAGLHRIPMEADVVVVHDAARPLASPTVLERGLAVLASTDADAVVPGIPVVDTVKELEGPADLDRDPEAVRTVVRTLDRARLVAVQTPQVFRAASLRRAHSGAAEGTDDAALVEAAGGTVLVIPGEAVNVKITTPDDLELVRRHVGGPGGSDAETGLARE